MWLLIRSLLVTKRKIEKILADTSLTKESKQFTYQYPDTRVKNVQSESNHQEPSDKPRLRDSLQHKWSVFFLKDKERQGTIAN